MDVHWRKCHSSSQTSNPWSATCSVLNPRKCTLNSFQCRVGRGKGRGLGCDWLLILWWALLKKWTNREVIKSDDIFKFHDILISWCSSMCDHESSATIPLWGVSWSVHHALFPLLPSDVETIQPQLINEVTILVILLCTCNNCSNWFIITGWSQYVSGTSLPSGFRYADSWL